MTTVRNVLLLPLNYDHVQHGMITGFRQVFGGDRVAVFDFMCAAPRPLGPASRTPAEVNNDFVEYVSQRKPDLVFMQLQETGIINAEAIKFARSASPKTVFAHWTGDYRPTISDYVKSVCRATDLTFASSVGQLKDFTLVGAADVNYMQIGIDWEADILGIPAWEPPFAVPEIVFCGNHYPGGPWARGTAQRLADIRALKREGYDVGVVGRGWPDDIPVVGECAVKQQHHVYTRAKVVLSISHENDVDRYYSDRLLIAMASGTATIARRFPGFDEDFPDGVLPTYEDETELFELVADMRATEAWRKVVGLSQRAYVRATASWFSRITQQLLPMVEEYIND